MSSGETHGAIFRGAKQKVAETLSVSNAVTEAAIHFAFIFAELKLNGVAEINNQYKYQIVHPIKMRVVRSVSTEALHLCSRIKNHL